MSELSDAFRLATEELRLIHNARRAGQAALVLGRELLVYELSSLGSMERSETAQRYGNCQTCLVRMNAALIHEYLCPECGMPDYRRDFAQERTANTSPWKN